MEFSDLIIVRCHGHRGVQVPPSVTIHCINKFQFDYVSCTVLNKKPYASTTRCKTGRTRMWANPNLMVVLPNIGGALCSTPSKILDPPPETEFITCLHAICYSYEAKIAQGICPIESFLF